MQIEHFFTHADSEFVSEHCSGMANKNSTHSKNITPGSGLDMVKINNRSVCISYANAME